MSRWKDDDDESNQELRTMDDNQSLKRTWMNEIERGRQWRTILFIERWQFFSSSHCYYVLQRERLGGAASHGPTRPMLLVLVASEIIDFHLGRRAARVHKSRWRSLPPQLSDRNENTVRHRLSLSFSGQARLVERCRTSRSRYMIIIIDSTENIYYFLLFWTNKQERKKKTRNRTKQCFLLGPSWT